MKLRSLTAVAVPVVLASVAAGPALASAPPVSVRVEGPSQTLLSMTNVLAPSHGSITVGHTPKGQCPADSAAGALDQATHGRFSGKYYKGLGIDVGTILGRRLSFAQGSYWGFYINDRLSSKGVCSAKLARGESLLFAAIPAKGKTPLPLVVKAPASATAGDPVTVKVYDYPSRSNATKPVAGATIDGVKTNRNGTAQVTLTRTTSLTATKSGFIRSAAAPVSVSG